LNNECSLHRPHPNSIWLLSLSHVCTRLYHVFLHAQIKETRKKERSGMKSNEK
jgi:hypothetical protein